MVDDLIKWINYSNFISKLIEYKIKIYLKYNWY